MTTKKTILKAIKDKCLDCCCDNFKEVELCQVGKKCTMFFYRFGKDPNPCKAKNPNPTFGREVKT